METEAWRSITVIEDRNGEPHVLQQKERVFTAGVSEESGGHTRPLPDHRLVKLTDVVAFG